MKAKLVIELDATTRAEHPEIIERDGKRYWPAGTVLEDARAYRLVQMGVAEPADQECTLRACMTKDEMKASQRQQKMVGKGIHPDDYQRYLDGEITGYDADGNDIPGPNWVDPDDEEETDDD